MKIDFFHRSTFSIILPILILLSLIIFSQWTTINANFDSIWSADSENNTLYHPDLNSEESKHRGAHVFGYLNSANLQAFIQNNFDWITLVSYGAQEDFDSPDMVYYRGDSLAVHKRDSMWKSQINIAHTHGFKVFMKPHLWITSPSEEKWRSDIFPVNDDNWNLWQKTYREYILLYAKIAQQNNVELFCIGTELSRLSVEKSDFWRSLIKEIRSVYSGKLTYAANWHEEYEKITFWDELDFIGIQAYFPLAKNEYPSVEQISNGWNKYLPSMESISRKYKRKILFTEMGYKSTSDSAIEPWQWIENNPDSQELFSTETQANCYEAFFNSVWDKEWFGGVHIWQMRSDYEQRGRDNTNLDFTPQGKPAENIIAKGFEYK